MLDLKQKKKKKIKIKVCLYNEKACCVLSIIGI